MKWLAKIFGRKTVDKADFQPDSTGSAGTDEVAAPVHIPSTIPLHLSAILLAAEERYGQENPVQAENEEMGSAAESDTGMDTDPGTDSID